MTHLPPELELGPHRLKLLAVSRNVDDMVDARRCIDHALTAFCYVGEMLTASSDAPIAWYYSPLYQFDRKKIRVEESVIAAALTKAMAKRSATTGLSSRSDFADTVASSVMSKDKEDEENEAEKEGGEEHRRSSLPEVFIRLGNSTTFREYKLITAVPHECEKEATTTITKETDTTVDSTAAATASHATPPLLRPMLPRKPPLKPLSSRCGSFSVRRLPLKRAGFNNYMPAAVASSAPNLVEEKGAAAAVATATPHAGLSLDTVASAFDAGEGSPDCGDSVRTTTSKTSAPAVPPAPVSVFPVQHSETSPLSNTSETGARKGTLTGHAGSSLSSAFLSTSNCPSGRVSRLPTSTMSAACFPGTEFDIRLSSTHGGYLVSAPSSDDVPLLVSSVLSRPGTQSPSGPTPPSSQPLRTPHRPPLRARVAHAHSDSGSHGCCGPNSQSELDHVRAVTPPSMHVS